MRLLDGERNKQMPLWMQVPLRKAWLVQPVSREARSNTESNRPDSLQDASTLPKMLRILQRKARVR
jgi:hypothetical protein